MKKILVILLTMAFLLGIYVPCFADGYVPSPKPKDPIVVVDDDKDTGETEKPSVIIKPDEPEKEPEKHEIEIEVHSYQYIDDIKNEESKKQLKHAYDEIASLDDVSKLVPDEIEQLAHSLGAETTDLVVRDLFDVSAYLEGEELDDTLDSEYSFTLHADNLENFVCLLVYHNNEWKIVNNVEVLKDQDLLKVVTKELSPFAIIVASKFTYNGVIKGCIWHLYIVITMLVTFVLAQFIRRKDTNTNQDKKKNILFRDILCLISLILSVIFYIFGTCKYDVYALIADIIIVTIVFIYNHPLGKDSDNE